MKLVVDIDTITSNLTNLNSGVEEYSTAYSSFNSNTLSSTITTITETLESYKNNINTSLEEIETNSTNYINLVDECCSEYQNNEKETTAIDVSAINTFISENPDVTYNYNGNSNSALTGLSSTLITQVSDDKYINLSGVDANSKVGQAIEKYSDEIENAKYAYIDKDHFVIVTEETVNGKSTLVSHIVINSGDQINGSPANGTYASGLETATSAADRLNSVLLVNGSHFDYSDGSEDLKGANQIVIVNSEIKTDGTSGGNELLLDKDGNIYNVSGKSAQELVDDGVKYSFSCHSTQVIENGDTSPSYRETNSYKRTVIGQSDELEYYIVTDETYDNSLSGTAEYLKEKGCENAYSLDQGGSVTLVEQNKLINNPSGEGENGERAVGDFLYFT